MTVLNPLEQAQKVENRTNSSFSEVVGYLQHRTDAGDVLGQLRYKGLPGQLLSGEVCLEEAARDPEDGERWIERSIGYFSRAWRPEDTRVVTPYTPIATKAALRLAQVGVLRPILLHDELPEAAVVEQAKRETVIIAAHVGNIIMQPNAYRQTSVKKDCIGILSEVAVLGLAQRFSIRKNVADCWQATPTLLSSERGTVRRGVLKDGWDIDVWSKQDTSGPEVAYRVQVKSSDRIRESYASGIAVVNVAPDLALPGKDGTIPALRVISELQAEQDSRRSRGRLSRMLDRRTTQLLDAIER